MKPRPLTHSELYNTEQDDVSDKHYQAMKLKHKKALAHIALDRESGYRPSPENLDIVDMFIPCDEIRKVLSKQYAVMDILETRIALQDGV